MTSVKNLTIVSLYDFTTNATKVDLAIAFHNGDRQNAMAEVDAIKIFYTVVSGQKPHTLLIS